jgi:hypothetical protein
VPKTAKVLAKGMSPTAASPAAVPIMSASATPALKNRSGNSLANQLDRVEELRSASRATMSGFSFPRARRVLP